MSRRREISKRTIIPDPRFGDRLVAKFINVIMRNGKKSVAEGIMYGAFGLIEQRAQDEPLRVFRRALDNVRPRVEVKSRRVGGATYQVPVEVRPDRSVTLALRWLVSFSKARREKTMIERLANEILDASNGLGAAVKRREDTHKMAEANRAFSHFKW